MIIFNICKSGFYFFCASVYSFIFKLAEISLHMACFFPMTSPKQKHIQWTSVKIEKN